MNLGTSLEPKKDNTFDRINRIYRKQETRSNERSNSVNSVQEPKKDNTFDRINGIYRKQETRSNERSNSVNSVPLACCFPVNPVNPVKGLFATLRLSGANSAPAAQPCCPDKGRIAAEAASRYKGETGAEHRRVLSQRFFQRASEKVPGRADASSDDRAPDSQKRKDACKAGPKRPAHLIEKSQRRGVSHCRAPIDGFRV